MTTPSLFRPITLGPTTLRNRIVVAPMCQYSARDGDATAWHHVHLGSLASGGSGLVLLEATAVEPRGRITPDDLGLWSDANERALAAAIKTVREVAPGVPLGIQLAHAGRKASCFRPWSGRGPVPREQGGWETIGPSPLNTGTLPLPREMGERELAEVREAFLAATHRAIRLGLEAIELHSAHGYLMSSFLSPLANRRTDRYGGSLENRMRFPLEVFEAMRKATGTSCILGIRFSGTDWAEGGWTVDESVIYARELKARGADYVHVSSGGNATVQVEAKPGWQVPLAAAVRRGSGAVTIAVGELGDPKLANATIENGEADLVALGKTALREPHWPWRAARELGLKPSDAVAMPGPYGWCVGG